MTPLKACTTAALAALIALAGCMTKNVKVGDGPLPTETPKVEIDPHHLEKLATGSSRLRFNPLPSNARARSLRLAFHLAPGGQLSVLAFASPALESAFRLRFSRVEHEVYVTASAGKNAGEFVLPENTVDAEKVVTLILDFDAGASPTRVRAWKREPFSAENTLFVLEGVNSPGSGAGAAWALELDRAEVLTAAFSAPKLP